MELPTFDGSTNKGTNMKSSSFECDDALLQFLKSENQSKKSSIIKNHALYGGKETNNDEAKVARETTNGKVVIEEEVDPLIKKEKPKEKKVKNMGCGSWLWTILRLLNLDFFVGLNLDLLNL